MAVFELHGSQRMPGPLTYFRYPIGPMLLRNTWVAYRGPHTYFSVIRLMRNGDRLIIWLGFRRVGPLEVFNSGGPLPWNTTKLARHNRHSQ